MTGMSRRERQILDILYSRGRATAAEIQAALPDPPSNSATRALLRILEDKGHIRHESEGPRYVFLPKVSRQKARTVALKHMLTTFFDGSSPRKLLPRWWTDPPPSYPHRSWTNYKR